MGRGKKQRLAARRAKGVLLKVAVITAPSSTDEGVSLARDIELVKASALYADEIELVSVGAAMLASVALVAEGGDAAMMQMLTGLDDDTIRHLNGGAEMPDKWREVLTFLNSPAAEKIPGVDGVVNDMREAMRRPHRQLTETSERLLAESGAEELMPGIESGLVRLSPAGFSDSSGDIDDVMENWLALIKRLLVDPKTRLVLDDQVGSLAAAMIREGAVDPNRLTLLHAGQAAVGSGLVARLPSFPQAPLDEILDLRADLAGPLGKYRGAVVCMADRLTSAPFGDDLGEEINDLWLNEVEPALTDITEGMHEHGFVRELAHTLTSSTKELIGGGAGIYVGFAQLASVNDWVSAAAGVAGPAVHAVASSKSRSDEQRGALQAHDLFYLYETERRLRQ